MKKYKKLEIAGQTFGRLTALTSLRERRARCIVWLFSCSCGNQHRAKASDVVRGLTRSCGCLHDEVLGRSHPKHGHSAGGGVTRTYKSWISMKQRCSNPNKTNGHLYHGRGIKVCERWNKFENFLADMGERPPGMTLDRIDNNSHYFPENCRWATPVQQSNNLRQNRIVELNGVSHTIAQWAVILKIPDSTLRGRLARGISIEQALIGKTK